MEFKGTKGKWRNIKLAGRYVVGNDENSTLHFIDCWLAGIGGIETDEEAKANAILISKAPEMLEFLIELYNDKETYSDLFPSQQEKLEQLIKEATGL